VAARRTGAISMGLGLLPLSTAKPSQMVVCMRVCCCAERRELHEGPGHPAAAPRGWCWMVYCLLLLGCACALSCAGCVADVSGVLGMLGAALSVG
jgi:hypothetical protein